MDLKFSEITVDTTLAQEYLKNNNLLLMLHDDYNGTIDQYSEIGEDYLCLTSSHDAEFTDQKTKFKNFVLKLKQNAILIAQLEYHIRNIPMEVTHAQINLLIQHFRSWSHLRPTLPDFIYRPDDSLLVLMFAIGCVTVNPIIRSKELVAICYLLVTLYREAGSPLHLLMCKETKETSAEDTIVDNLKEYWPVKGLDSGTVAVVSDDADVDSAVDKFISVSKQAPWRLRRILVQESVYQEFKEALTWKCKLNKSGSKPPTHNVLCSATLTYNDKTYLIDPVQLVEEQPSVVTIEAYRTTKEMISLVQQYKTRYLSLWINGVAEINEVTHNTSAPVVWVNTVADFRGPPQISHAVFSFEDETTLKSCAEVDQLRKLSQSWLKLDFESRRDVLCGVLDEYILLDPKNKLYTDMKHSISSCTHKSFVDVGKDYVCIGMVQPIGILVTYDSNYVISVKGFESILQGNALVLVSGSRRDYTVLEKAELPVVTINHYHNPGDFKVSPDNFMRTRVIWTNSGTIFAN